MKVNFVEELKWRNMLHDIMPGTEEMLSKEAVSGYIGFDPTADSLHLGSLMPVMTLLHFQKCGHKPIAVVGGATGMVGDPSGKTSEREILTEEVLQHNLSGIKSQLEKFLDCLILDFPINYRDKDLVGFFREFLSALESQHARKSTKNYFLIN